MIHCLGCHTMTGGGMPPEVPAFDESLGHIVGVPGGRAYLIQVPGASQSLLNDEHLADVLSWLLTEFVGEHLPQDFKNFSADEVAKYRSITLTNPAIIRDELLSKL